MPTEQVFAALIGIIGLAAGGFATYLTTRLVRSGNVKTSSADKLWEAYTTLLNAYVNDNGRLRTQVEQARLQIHALEVRATTSELREADCDRRNVQLQGEVSRMQAQMESLRQSIVDTATVAIDNTKLGQ